MFFFNNEYLLMNMLKHQNQMLKHLNGNPLGTHKNGWLQYILYIHPPAFCHLSSRFQKAGTSDLYVYFYQKSPPPKGNASIRCKWSLNFKDKRTYTYDKESKGLWCFLCQVLGGCRGSRCSEQHNKPMGLIDLFSGIQGRLKKVISSRLISSQSNVYWQHSPWKAIQGVFHCHWHFWLALRLF